MGYVNKADNSVWSVNLQLGQLLTPKGTSESGGIVNVKVFR